MELLKTSQTKNIWKIAIFFIMFIIIDTVTAFIGAGVILIFKYFNLISLFNVPSLVLLELIIRYGLAFIIIVWLNHRYMKQPVSIKSDIPFNLQKYPLLLALIMIIIYISTINIKTIGYNANTMSFLMFSCGSALLEEYGFRGIIFPKITQLVKGNTFCKLIFGVIISSILFGLFHSVNVFYQPFLVTLQQVLGAIPFGILMAILYARTSSIITPILYHFSSDFNSYFTTNSFLTSSFYNGWGQILINYGIAILAVMIFLRPAIAKKLKIANSYN